MLKNFLLLFFALRAADLLNLLGGTWLVPKFVAPEDLGAVLPLTTLATLLAIPLYAVAMTALRESSRLRSLKEDEASPASERDGQIRSFVRGVFAASGVAAVIALALAAALLPRYIGRANVSDSLSGYLAVAAALLGCVSPVYLDQLQAAKRFGAVSVIEISAAALRLAVMAALMPIRALTGYFAGGVTKTLVQILGPLVALCRDGQSVPSGDRGRGSYWTHDNILRLLKTFLLLLPYLWLPLQVSFMENDLVRTLLPTADSAGYYMATRISDLMNYITFPILFVMFPYVTDRASRGESYDDLVVKSIGVIVAVSIVAVIVTSFCGERLISLLPNGENYTAYAKHLFMLILFMGCGAAQNIATNAEVAAGRFSFLLWFIPVNGFYLYFLPKLNAYKVAEYSEPLTLENLTGLFFLFAFIRFTLALLVKGLSQMLSDAPDTVKGSRHNHKAAASGPKQQENGKTEP